MNLKDLRSGTASGPKITPNRRLRARAVPGSDALARSCSDQKLSLHLKGRQGVFGGAISTFLGLALWTSALFLAARWGFHKVFDE